MSFCTWPVGKSHLHAAQPPLILIFNISSVAVLIHPDGQSVLRVEINKRSHIKLIRISTSLRISHLFSIDPNMERSIDALEPKTDLAMFEFLGNAEFADIGPSLIFCKGDVGRVYWDMVDDVCVLGAFTEAL